MINIVTDFQKFIQATSAGSAMMHGGRLALSKQSSRFELPMDMMILESKYFQYFCRVG